MLTRHPKIIKVHEEFKFAKDIAGLCRGITIAWLEACKLGQEKDHYARISRIMRSFYRPDEMYGIHNKIRNNQTLSEFETADLNIFTWLHKVELFQHPHLHSDLFGAHLRQQDIEIISQLASSGLILEQGGLTTAYSEATIYNKKELQAYLDELEAAFLASGCTEYDSVTMVLDFSEHAVGLVYRPKTGWIVMDVNTETIEDFNLVKSTSEVAGLIDYSYRISHQNEKHQYIPLNVAVICTQKDPLLPALKKELSKIKENHLNLLTEEMAQRAESVNLAWMAVRNNDVEQLAALITNHSRMDASNSKGINSIYLAVIYQNLELLQLLLKNTDDAQLLNDISIMGTVPMSDAIYGNKEIVRTLINAGANVNFVNQEGDSLLYIAVKHGFKEIIPLLTEAGADVNFVNAKGVPVLYLAALMGQTEVVRDLIKHGANVNQPHENKTSNQIISPAFIAAQSGFKEVVIALLESKADFTIPFVTTEDSLRKFAASKDKAVIARTEAFIKKQLASDPNRTGLQLTPCDIAQIMGHEDLVRLLDNENINETHGIREGQVFSKLSGKYYKLLPVINPELDDLSKALSSQGQEVNKNSVIEDIKTDTARTHFTGFKTDDFFGFELEWQKNSGEYYRPGNMTGSMITDSVRKQPGGSPGGPSDQGEFSIAYRNDSGELCGFSFWYSKRDPDLWVAVDIQNTTADPSQRVVTIVNNRNNFSFSSKETNTISEEKIESPDKYVLDIISNQSLRTFLEDKLLDNGTARLEALARLDRGMKARHSLDQMFGRSKIYQYIAEGDIPENARKNLLKVLDRMESSEDYQEFMQYLKKGEHEFIQALIKVLPEEAGKTLKYIQTLEENSPDSLAVRWLNNSCDPAENLDELYESGGFMEKLNECFEKPEQATLKAKAALQDIKRDQDVDIEQDISPSF